MSTRTRQFLLAAATSILALPAPSRGVTAAEEGGKRLWRACVAAPEATAPRQLVLEEIGAAVAATTWAPLAGTVEPEAVLAVIPERSAGALLVWLGRAPDGPRTLFSSRIGADGVSEGPLGLGPLAEGAPVAVLVESWPLGWCGLEGAGAWLHVVFGDAAGEATYRAVELEPGLEPWVSPAITLAAIEPPGDEVTWVADGAALAAGEVEASAVVAVRSGDDRRLGVFALELEELGDKRRGLIDGYGACGSPESGADPEVELPEVEGNGLRVAVRWAETVSLPAVSTQPVTVQLAPHGGGMLSSWVSEDQAAWATRELGGAWSEAHTVSFAQAEDAAAFGRLLARRFAGEVAGGSELEALPGPCGPPPTD